MGDKTSRRNLLKAFVSAPALGLGVIPVFAEEIKAKPKDDIVIFHEDDLQDIWTCLPFVFKAPPEAEAAQVTTKTGEHDHAQMGHHSKDKMGYVIKLPSGETMAFQRNCSTLGCKFEFIRNPEDGDLKFDESPSGPVFVCKCHGSAFDLLKDGKVIAGPERNMLTSFRTKRCGDKICVINEKTSIHFPSATSTFNSAD